MNKLAPLALALSFIGLSPTLAFDELKSVISTVHLNTGNEVIFNYIAPRDGFSPKTAWTGNSTSRGMTVMLKAGRRDSMTGVDFSGVHALFSAGMPPQTTDILFGTPGFAQHTPEALRKRKFETRDINGITVYGLGKDLELNRMRALEQDPFNAGMGVSERIAILADRLILSTSWDRTEEALAGTTAPDSQLLAATLAALENAAGADALLTAAAAWEASVFLRDGANIDYLLETGTVADHLGDPTTMPMAYPFAFFAVTEATDSAALHIALPFGDLSTAQSSAQLIAERIARLPEPLALSSSPAQVHAEVAEGFAVAVVSVVVPRMDAEENFARWQAAVIRKQFSPLYVTP